MRLLPKPDLKNKVAEEELIKTKRIADTERILADGEKRLNEFRDRDRLEREGIQIARSIEEQRHTDRVTTLNQAAEDLSKEIIELEDYRAALLVPVDLRDKELTAREVKIGAQEKLLTEFLDREVALKIGENDLHIRQNEFKVWCEFREKRLREERDKLRLYFESHDKH